MAANPRRTWLLVAMVVFFVAASATRPAGANDPVAADAPASFTEVIFGQPATANPNVNPDNQEETAAQVAPGDFAGGEPYNYEQDLVVLGH